MMPKREKEKEKKKDEGGVMGREDDRKGEEKLTNNT